MFPLSYLQIAIKVFIRQFGIERYMLGRKRKTGFLAHLFGGNRSFANTKERDNPYGKMVECAHRQAIVPQQHRQRL